MLLPTLDTLIPEALRPRLNSFAKYEVIPILLVSERKGDRDSEIGANLATAGNLKLVLDWLAGRELCDDGNPLGVTGVRKATPEDLVLFHVQYGYTDEQGEYYFFPSDIGPGTTVTPAFLKKCVSSRDFSSWF